MWYLHCCCELYRACLPGGDNESLSPEFLAAAQPEFVAEWRNLAVSCALHISRLWSQLQQMRATAAIQLKHNRFLLGIGFGTVAYQCSNILLLARRSQRYSNLIDPVTGEPATLDDDTVDRLCQSNISFLDDIATLAPIAAVMQQDVKNLVKRDQISRQTGVEAGKTPLPSPTFRDQKGKGTVGDQHSMPQGLDSNNPIVDEVALRQRNMASMPSPFASISSSGASESDETQRQLFDQPLQAPGTYMHQQPTPHSSIDFHITAAGTEFGLADQTVWFDTGGQHSALNYFVMPSEFDMGGELSWFLSSLPDQGNPGES